MQNQKKSRITAIRITTAVRGLLILFFMCVIIKAAATVASGTLGEEISTRLNDENAASRLLSFELGGYSADAVSKIAEMFTPSEEITVEKPETIETAENLPQEVHNEPEPQEDALFHNEESTKSEETTEPPPALSVPVGTEIALDNTTDYEIDINALLSEPLNIKLSAGEPAVLIIHTHTSEAYTPSGSDKYVSSDPYRTEDQTQNIARVGKELASEFEKRGISVIHDTKSYDYPSYTGAYNRTYTSVQSYLKQYPSIKLVIDLHRDSIAASDGTQYKTIAQIDGGTCSQVMFVIGSEAAGLVHPNWQENLTLALYIQREMNTLYPSLARPVRISGYRYNQQLTPGASIVEIGCAGNTLQESLTAVRYFAGAAANVILSLYD